MPDPTTGDLCKAKTITDEEVNAAVDCFLNDMTTRFFQFASGHSLDLADAIRTNQPARGAVAHPDRSDKFRRRMVLTAILLARPTGS